jgi:hypothetical protein
VEYVPAKQGLQVAAPWGDQVPAAQLEQLVDPNTPAAVPASHMVQTDCPVNMLKEPLLHWAQVSALVAATVSELVPAAQAVQLSLPRVVLKKPAEHSVQGPPLGPV